MSPSPLKIGILVDRITPGATPKFLGREIKYLRELGYEAEGVVISETGLPAGQPQFEEYLSDVPLRYLSIEHPVLRRFDFPIPPFSFFRGFDLLAGFMVPRFLKTDVRRYDVLVAHGSIACWIASRIKRKLGIPYFAVYWDALSFIIDDVYRKKLPKPLLPIALSLAKRMDQRLIDESICAVTGSDTYASLGKRYTDRDLLPLYPGVDIPESIPPSRGDFLLTIDRWDIGNMPNWLLDVVAGLSKPIPLKVAGFWWPPQIEEEFHAAVRTRGLENQVEVLGPVTEARLIELFHTARAMIFPHRAAINFVVMEAAANGCPTVMQKSIDLFEHGVTGFFPDCGPEQGNHSNPLETHRPSNISEFVACTDALVADERLAWDLGRNARELMKLYSWRHRAERLASLIEQHLPRTGEAH